MNTVQEANEILTEVSQYLAERDFINAERAFQRFQYLPVENLPDDVLRRYRSVIQQRAQFPEEVNQAVNHVLGEAGDIWDELAFSPMNDGDEDEMLDFDLLESDGDVEEFSYRAFKECMRDLYVEGEHGSTEDFEELCNREHFGWQIFQQERGVASEEAVLRLIRLADRGTLVTNSDVNVISYEPTTPLQSSSVLTEDS